MPLSSLSLKQISTLAVIAETRSLSKTALIIGDSQSNVSHSLKRLRSLFDDELFSRENGELAPTATLEHLLPAINEVVDAQRRLESVSATPSDDRIHRTIRIYCSSEVSVRYGASIRQALDAARIDGAIAFHRGDEQCAERVRGDSRAFLLQPTGYLPEDLIQQKLFDENWRWVMAPNHALARQPKIELDDALEQKHIVVRAYPGKGSVLDFAARLADQRRKISMIVSSYQEALTLLEADPQYLGCLPSRAIEVFGREDRLVTRNPGFSPLNAGYSVSLAWGPLHQKNPESKRIRSAIMQGIREAEEPQSTESSPTQSLERFDT